MKILEIIHLRLAGETSRNMVKLMREFIGPEPEGVEVRFYCHVKLENDIAVHLHREGAGREEGPSEVGTRLAALLKDYGMVDHSVWIDCRGRDETPGIRKKALRAKEGKDEISG